jgi:hypothetical protein
LRILDFFSENFGRNKYFGAGAISGLAAVGSCTQPLEQVKPLE